jgi:hypothetical protein
MRRRLLRLLSALSLLLCAATAVLWVRSYSGTDYVSRGKLLASEPEAVTSRAHEVRWTRGTIRLETQDLTTYPHGHAVPLTPANMSAYWGYGRLGAGHDGWQELAGNSLWDRLGFQAYQGGTSASFYDERISRIAVPAWLPAVAFAAPSLLWAVRHIRRRQRRRSGLCRACGYDLTANVSGTCPECGTIVSVKET